MSKFSHIFSDYNQRLIAFFNHFNIKQPKLKFWVSLFFFLAGLHLFYSYVGIYDYLERRPCSVHSWAQCQRAAVAQGYYKEDMNFFKPRSQNYTPHSSITGVEFPVIYYSAAICYKLFGFNEFYLRAISLAIVSLGLFFFFLLANKFVNNLFISLLVLGSAAASPVLLYYTPSFLPDAPANGFVLMAWYFFFKFVQTKQNKGYNTFVALATLAALIKVATAISLIIPICLLVLDRFYFFKTDKNERLFNKPLTYLFKIMFGIFLVFAWYAYANWLGKKYENTTFFLSAAEMLPGTFDKLVDSVRYNWAYQYYSYESYVLMIGAILVLFVLLKNTNRLLFTITTLYILGSACYVLFFLGQFINHDYYIISIIPSIFLLFLCFTDTINTLAKKYFLPLNLALVLVLIFNLKECLRNCKKNYTERYSNDSIYWSYTDRSFYDLEPKLRKAGIKRTDATVVAFDETFSNRLYFMDQLGYSLWPNADSATVHYWISKPESKYLVVVDSTQFKKVYPVDLSDKIVLYHRGLLVYKLK